MAHLMISDEDLQWFWKNKFQAARLLTVEDLLDLTIDRGKDLGTILSCLDTTILPGISRKVAERFIDQEVKNMLPKEVLSDADFKAMFSDLRKHFNTNNEAMIRGQCFQRYKKIINRNSPDNVKRAMMAYIEFGLGNYVAAISNAEFAINESQVPNFRDEIDRRSSAATKELLKTARTTATLILEVAREMQALKK